jgi:catechol 2,3-dioxygenase-like lactoylglutathione lyase family enzyme
LDPGLPIRSLDYSVIFTQHMDRMCDFYGETMRFPLHRKLSPSWIEYRVGSTILALAKPGPRHRGASPSAGGTSVQLAFRVAPEEVDLCAQTLAARGVEIASPPTDQPFGHRTLFFYDPDGNILEIYAEIWPAKPAQAKAT